MRAVLMCVLGAALAVAPQAWSQSSASNGAMAGATQPASTDRAGEAWTMLGDSLAAKKIDTRIAALTASFSFGAP